LRRRDEIGQLGLGEAQLLPPLGNAVRDLAEEPPVIDAREAFAYSLEGLFPSSASIFAGLTHIATKLYIADMRYNARVALLLSACALLGLAEGAFLMQSVLRVSTAVSVVTGGVLAAVLLWRFLSPDAVVVVAFAGLFMSWAVLYAAFLVQLAGRGASEIVFFLALAIPFAVAGLAVLGVTERLRGRSYPWAICAVGVALGLGILAAGARSPWLNDPRPPARFHAIDEVAGSYSGVGIGNDPARMMEVFGPTRALGESDAFRPTGAQDFSEGPWFVQAAGGFAYEDVLFWLRPSDRGIGGEPAKTGRIWGFEITSPGVETARGVAMGDDLDAVQGAYSGFECGENDRGEYGTNNYCMGTVAPGRFLYFGGDPITSISVTQGRVSP
jgi:hypothetical protein